MEGTKTSAGTITRARGHLLPADRMKIAEAINNMGYDNLYEFCNDRRLCYSTIYNIMKRSECNVRSSTLRMLATALGTTPDQLLNGPSIATLYRKLWD